MVWLQQYMLSVVSVAILCGLVQLFLSENTGITGTLKIIMGVIIAVTVISPILNLDDISVDGILDEISLDSAYAVADGEQFSYDYISTQLKEEAESYIHSKANTLGVQIVANVSVSEGMPPTVQYATIRGTVTPHAKKQLSAYMEEQLGIAKEDQTWTS